MTTAADVYATCVAEVDEMPREPAADVIDAGASEPVIRQLYVEAGVFDAAESRTSRC